MPEALGLLLRRYEWSVRQGFSPRHCAVVLADLRGAGVAEDALDWLVRTGQVVYLVKAGAGPVLRGADRDGVRVPCGDDTCFGLTEAGVALARQWSETGRPPALERPAAGFVLLRRQPAQLGIPDLHVPAGPCILGRAPECQLVVKHPSVSRRHAEIALVGAGISVTDLGSRNGTFLNHVPVARCVVTAGVQIRFASVEFLVVRNDFPPDDTDDETGSVEESPSIVEQALGKLSPFQRQVFCLLRGPLTEKEIAVELKQSPDTVHNQVKAVYRILGVHSRTELLVRYPPSAGDNSTTLT